MLCQEGIRTTLPCSSWLSYYRPVFPTDTIFIVPCPLKSITAFFMDLICPQHYWNNSKFVLIRLWVGHTSLEVASCVCFTVLACKKYISVISQTSLLIGSRFQDMTLLWYTLKVYPTNDGIKILHKSPLIELWSLNQAWTDEHWA